jgi:hypothetical protein
MNADTPGNKGPMIGVAIHVLVEDHAASVWLWIGWVGRVAVIGI